MTPIERSEFISDLATALAAQVKPPTLSDDEVHALKLLIKRQEQSVALRQSIIDKSLTSLVWAAIIGVGLMFKSWATQHGYVP